MKTIQSWALDALHVQDACNLSGVAHAFKRFFDDHPDAPDDHPVCVLFIDKFEDLSGSRRFPMLAPNDGETVSVLAQRLSAAMAVLCKHRLGHDTHWRNSHCVARCIIRQLAHASGSRGVFAFSQAYDACEALANDPDEIVLEATPC